MKFIRLIIGLVAAVAALPAFAQTTETATAVVGKVVKIYVRESSNFFIETSLVRNAHGKQYWSEVRFAEPLADEAVITEIDQDFPGDAFAPDLGPQWREVARERGVSAQGLRYSFVTYRRSA